MALIMIESPCHVYSLYMSVCLQFILCEFVPVHVLKAAPKIEEKEQQWTDPPNVPYF